MKILFVSFQIPSTEDPQSGSFNKSRINALAKNHTVDLIVPSILSPSIKKLLHIFKLNDFFRDIKRKWNSKILFKNDNVRIVHKLWIKPPRKFWFITALIEKRLLIRALKSIQDTKYDLIIASSLGHDSLSVSLIKSLAHIPFLAISEGTDVYETLFKNVKQKVFFENTINSRKGNIIAVSEHMKAFIKDNYNFDNVLCIENGFEKELFKYEASEKGSIPILVSTGRLEKVKNFPFLIKVLSKVNIDFKCYIIGKGSEEDRLKSLVKEMNLESKVIFLGYMNQDLLNEVYRYANLFLVTSHYESFSIAALEAMGSGLPVIGPDIDGIKNLVEEGVNGYIYKSDYEFSLKETIEKAVSNDWCYRSISVRAHNNYSWDKWAEKIEKVIKNE